MTRPTEPAAATPAPAAADFLRTLTRSGLVARGRLAALLADVPAAVRSSARTFADHLVAAGVLTRYQVGKLLAGRWQGLVLGPYHVLAPLGRGGMGTVYLARNTGGVGDLIALKVLPPRRAREEERTLARFRREMALGRHLDHPSVTRTLDAGEAGGVHYIAMEFVPGHTLRQLVVKDGPLPVADVARIFADVAAGLAHAHDRGLIHRDLKPGNIMVTPDGRAKVLDLGMALLEGETLPADPTVIGGKGYVLGTMDYIAPEQTTDSAAVGPPADLYAMGCSLYFALTGVPPFPGGTSQQKIRWHRTEAPPPADTLNPAVPAEVARLVERLMAKDPADRPESAEAVRGLLLPWAGQPHAEVPPVQDVVAEVDTRAHDPSLWDAAPVPTEQPADIPDEDDPPYPEGEELGPFRWWPLLAVVGAFVAVAGLAVSLGLLRRL